MTTNTRQVDIPELLSSLRYLYKEVSNGEQFDAEATLESMIRHYEEMGFDPHARCSSKGYCNYIPECSAGRST